MQALVNTELFVQLVHGVMEYDGYLLMNKDRTEMAGLSSIQKCGAREDAHDDCVSMSDSAAIQSMDKFCRTVVEVFDMWIWHVFSA